MKTNHSELPKSCQHTPGPWEVHHEPSLNRFAIRADPFGTRTILSVSYWERTLPWNRELAESNARLIAAAPDLLHYAKAETAWRACDGRASEEIAFRANYMVPGGRPVSDWLVSLRHAAIAKAEGGAA